MTTYLTADLTIASGETITFVNAYGYYITQALPSNPAASLTVNGSLVLTADQFSSPAAIQVNTPYDQSHAVTVGATGSIQVTNTTPGGRATGYAGIGYGPDFTNHGQLAVSALYDAEGLNDSAGRSDVINTGTILVQSPNAAFAVFTTNVASVFNSGTITAKGGGVMFGVKGGGDSQSLTNTGTIQADPGPDAAHPSYAVQWDAVFSTVDNSGTLQGDIGLATSAHAVTNSGQILGAVQLMNSNDKLLMNSGTISGSVDLGVGDDTYSGLYGGLQNVLHGGDGSDLIIGGAGAETLSGDAGDDTIEGGGGADMLDGGAGHNTLSFEHSWVAVSFATTSHTIATTGATVSNFQNLIGSQYGDNLSVSADGARLAGGYGDDTLSCGAGATTVDGGPGQDLIVCGSGPDRIVIGAGESSALAGHPDIIQNWSSGDTLQFANSATTPDNFTTASASDYASALTTANVDILLQGYKYVAVAVGSDVVVFADSGNDRGVADDAVVLQGRTLADISAANIVAAPAQPLVTTTLAASAPAAPAEPGAPSAGGDGAHGTVVGNMDAAHLADLFPAVLTQASTTHVTASGAGGLGFDLSGSGFSYSNNQLVGGTATHLTLTDVANGATVLQQNLSLPQTDVSNFEFWLANNQTQTAFQSILAHGDQLNGGASGDLIRGYAGNDQITGAGGNDSLFGGDGNDVISAASGPAGSTWLRGEAGDDYIVGGAGFDNVNGNQGNDTLDGGTTGNDWLVGGQGNDMIFAHGGSNILNGNLGDDSIVGGADFDYLRGGQGNDVIWASSSGAWITGDRGNDTLIAGQGADTFYVTQGGGLDRIFGFDPAHDHVQIDPGKIYHLAQIGADVLVDIGQGDGFTLANVQLSALPAGWITA